VGDPLQPDPRNTDSKKNRAYIFLSTVMMCVIVIALILIFTCFGPLHNALAPYYSLNTAEYYSGAFALLGGGLVLLLTFSFFPDFDRTRLALMLEMAGAGLGWLLGMFFSPESPAEKQTFLSAKGALVGIFSGYLLSKLQTVFDRAVKDGKLLNANFVVFTLAFSIPMLLTTAVVYNQREYYTGRNLPVRISTANDDIPTTTINGQTEYQLDLSKSEQFIAQTIAPTNYVTWSVVPADGHGTIDPVTGKYTPPPQLPSDARVDIVATRVNDNTKVGQLSLTLVQTSTQEPPPRPIRGK
jgi:hypothetical protein